MTKAKALEGKAAIVTGGGGGIGSGCALHLLRDGAAVLLMGRTLATLEAARARLLAEVPDGLVGLHTGDGTAEDDVKAAMQAAHALLGRLDIIVTTVGRGGGNIPILMHDAASFRWVLDMNLVSAFLAMRYGVPLMAPRTREDAGAIVCISSTAGAMPYPSMSAYSAAKAGLEMFVRTAADEFASAHIRVNAVRPGLTPSGAARGLFADAAELESFRVQTPLAEGRGAMGEIDDIARMVRFLAGPETGWVTGQSIAVDGGHELRRNPDSHSLLVKKYGAEAVDKLRLGQRPD